MWITATAAPRSRRSSPSTTGAEAGVIGETRSSVPSATTSTCSRPPCRSAHWTSAETDRAASASVSTEAPSPETADPLRPELRRDRLGELARRDRQQLRLVAVALDPRGERELVDQLGELLRRRLDHLRIAAELRVEPLGTRDRTREPVHGRQRRAQVVAGQADELREGLFVGHVLPGTFEHRWSVRTS